MLPASVLRLAIRAEFWQLLAKQGKTEWISCYTPFTRYSRLSNRLYNWFDNRLYHVNKHTTGFVMWQPCWTNSHCSFNRLSNRFDKWFDNRLYRVNGALVSACCPRQSEQRDIEKLANCHGYFRTMPKTQKCPTLPPSFPSHFFHAVSREIQPIRS